MSPGMNKNYNHKNSTPLKSDGRISSSTSHKHLSSVKRSNSYNHNHGNMVPQTTGVNYFKTLSGSSYKKLSTGHSEKDMPLSSELNKTDPGLNKSVVSQFSLADQK